MTERKPLVWLHVFQDAPGSPITTAIGGPVNASKYEYGMLLADVLNHIVRARGIPREDILEIMHHELENPTTEYTGGTKQ